MKNLLLVILAFFSFNMVNAADKVLLPNEVILPEEFPVYVNLFAVLTHPNPGYDKRILPVSNPFVGKPGCYIACYSDNADNAVFSLSPLYHVHGMIRVPGSYEDSVCHPVGYEQDNLSKVEAYKSLCGELIPSCTLGKGCWAGGETGEFVGAE